MNFLDLMKLIHQTTTKSTKWPDEDISKVFVKCHHLHELNELLLFCKYQDYEADGMSKLYYNIVSILILYMQMSRKLHITIFRIVDQFICHIMTLFYH